MTWWRLSAACALISVFTLATVPTLAQDVPADSFDFEVRATRLAGEVATDWLGPSPHHEPERDDGTFDPEQAAQRVIRNWWPDQIVDQRANDIINGLSFYLQTRAIEKAFDYFFRRTAHSFVSQQYLGGHLTWYFRPLWLSRHAVASRDRYAAVFDSLERWIGTPALQAACYEVAHIPDDRLTADAIIKTVSDAAGQDLSWAFIAADVDYAVESISDTSVTVSRRGVAEIPRNAMTLKVTFADGAPVSVDWSGTEPSHTFQFSGPSKIVAAYLDPDRIIAFDRNHLNNSIVTPRPTNVPVRKWAARWMVWLQHSMLSYGFLA
jgi:hypothetical protein